MGGGGGGIIFFQTLALHDCNSGEGGCKTTAYATLFRGITVNEGKIKNRNRFCLSRFNYIL